MTVATVAGRGSARRLLEEAALFGALAHAWEYPGSGRHAGVVDALRRVRAAQPRLRARGALGAAFATAEHAWSAAAPDALVAEYLRLFRGSVPCPLHETAYGDGQRLGGREVELADIRGFYAAFGFTLAPGTPDLPDHLGAELEFVSLLLVKQAYALEAGLADGVRVVKRATADFLEQHLGRWLPAWLGRLQECEAAEAYASLGVLVHRVVGSACARRRLAPRLTTWRATPDVMQADTFSCPMAPES